MLADAEREWACISLHDKLIEVVKYRDDVCRKFNEGPAKQWWEFWK